MAKRKPAEIPASPKPKAVSKAKAPKGKTPLDSMIEAGDKLGIDGNAADEPMQTVNQEYQPATTEPVSSANPKEDNNEKTDSQTDRPDNKPDSEYDSAAFDRLFDAHEPRFQPEPKAQENTRLDEGVDANEPKATQATEQDGEKNRGNVAIAGGSADSIPGIVAIESVPRARLPSEKRHAYWERMRKAARLAGLPRGQGPGSAYVWATEQAEREFPYVVPEIVQELPEAEVEPVPGPPKPVPEAIAAPVQADGSVSGLSNFPESWPKLPANAQLQQEIAWVTANRLLVRDGTGVNLSRAMSPPPSYSALSWLETSILFPAKFADISVKATAENDDEKEFIRREKMAVEEIRSILKEMRDAKGT